MIYAGPSVKPRKSPGSPLLESQRGLTKTVFCHISCIIMGDSHKGAG